MSKLSGVELLTLIRRVFPEADEASKLLILTDIPRSAERDSARWRARREMVYGWVEGLREVAALPFEVDFVVYPDAGQNNADFPEFAWLHQGPLPEVATALPEDEGLRFDEVLSKADLVLAPTQLSTTAPLKVAARRHGFRAATMPGFDANMIPALKLDYVEVHRRCVTLKERLDPATAAHFLFEVEGNRHSLTLDLRHRSAHASGGLFPESGTAGNLPSGETYMVPYEGEIEGDSSRSQGVLPVELEGEVVLYWISENRAQQILSRGPVSEREAARIVEEPAYANIAELGLGVLGAYGVQPVGVVLLDEKLGLHIAFGRSDHFGGQVGPSDFSSPDAVVHIDRVYLSSLQPKVKVLSVDLEGEEGLSPLMREGEYV